MEDIDLPEHLVQELLDTVSREYLVHASGFRGFYDLLLGLGVFPIVNGLEFLSLRYRQNGLSYLQCINEIHQEVELPRLPLFLGFGLVIVHGEHHLLVLVVSEIVVVARVVALAPLDRVLNENDGRIILFGVFLLGRFHEDFRQIDTCRGQLDFQSRGFARYEFQFLGRIS